MKFPRLVLVFLLVAGLAGFLSCVAVLPGLQQHTDSGVFHDFAVFREASLKLPEKQESFCPAVLEEIVLPRNLAPKIDGHGEPDYSFLKMQWFGQSWDTARGSLAGLLNPEPLLEYRLVQSRRCDLDGDGIPEKYTLRDGIITVYAGSRLIWQSPEDWWVDYFLGDANNDGSGVEPFSLERGALVPTGPFGWKRKITALKTTSSFSSWQKGIANRYGSLQLDCPNYWAALLDLDGDGENELVVIEGSYTDPGKREVTLWKWNGWGFSRINSHDPATAAE